MSPHRFLPAAVVTVMLSASLFFAGAAPAHADVPVWVTHFDQCTTFEQSITGSFADIVFESERKLERFLQTFRLAQIEKAREDVAKLIYETRQELKEEALNFETRDMFCGARDPATGLCTKVINRLGGAGKTSRGIIIKKGADNLCPGGFMADIKGTGHQECILIKKEGRIITNVDEYLYEEPIAKARHYLMCYLGPWRFFPFANDTTECGNLGLTGTACTSRKVCYQMRQNGNQCKSDQLRDQLKFKILGRIHRKNRYIYRNTNPPEMWYTPERCAYILSFLSSPQCTDQNCSPPPVPGTSDYVSMQEYRARRERFVEDEPDLATQPAYIPEDVPIYFEDFDKSLDEKNSFAGIAKKVNENVDRIISEYQEIRKAEFLAGKGIRPEKYLIGLKTRPSACNRNKYGRLLDGCQDANASRTIFYFSTEDVIAPAVILLQKMQAATQAEFDLAQLAYKYPADQSEEIEFAGGSCSAKGLMGGFSLSGDVFSFTGRAPNISELPAPWEDTGRADSNRAVASELAADRAPNGSRGYTEVPNTYIKQKKPRYLSEKQTLNRWYKDVIELYEHSFTQPQRGPGYEGGKLPSVLADWFQLSGEPRSSPSGSLPGGVAGPPTEHPPPPTSSRLLVKSETISGVYCKEERMCEEIDQGKLDSCINHALRRLAQKPKFRNKVVVTETTGFHGGKSSYHNTGHAIDLRLISGIVRPMQKSLFKIKSMRSGQGPRVEIFGPKKNFCRTKTGKKSCAGDGTNHIHYACCSDPNNCDPADEKQI